VVRPAGSPDTIVVGLTESVSPAAAPVPATDAERLVFGSFYEPLVRLDCHGELRPALAGHWVVEDEGRRVTFSLRDGARFWDDTPVTAQHVLRSWAGTWVADSLGALDSRTVTAWFARTQAHPARVFADPRLAVALRDPAGRSPQGTAPLRIARWSEDRIEGIPAQGRGPTVVFRWAWASDPRDLLAHGADVVVTGDPATLDYARGTEAYSVVALPWTRTYVLIGPEWLAGIAGNAAHDRLALGAVRADARAAEAPFWWMDADCGDHGVVASPARSPTSPRIAYRAGDPVAQDLAARIVALASDRRMPDGGRLRAVALAGQAFDQALAGGTELAFVTGVERMPFDRCAPAYLRGAVPLVDTRRSVVVHRGGVGIAVLGDGTPRFLFQP
jgi:hypothetical protein